MYGVLEDRHRWRLALSRCHRTLYNRICANVIVVIATAAALVLHCTRLQLLFLPHFAGFVVLSSGLTHLNKKLTVSDSHEIKTRRKNE